MFSQVLYYRFLFCILMFYNSLTNSQKSEIDGLEWRVYCKFQADSHNCREGTRMDSRFYYDLKMQDCKTFLFGGCLYSYNTFTTKAMCRESCRDTALLPLKDINITAPVYCRFQPDFGDCNSYHPLWYYDIVHHRCRGFSYSGCGGNHNRFISQQMCMGVCGGTRHVKTTNESSSGDSVTSSSSHIDTRPEMDRLDHSVYCKFQADMFNCEDVASNRFYFDLKMEDCKPFLHGGCMPDFNMYRTMALCRDACRDKGLHPVTVNVSSNVFCRFQPDFGHCQEYHPLWYYDISQHTCRGFSYSGCGGNINRFLTYESCMAVCGGFRIIHKTVKPINLNVTTNSTY